MFSFQWFFPCCVTIIPSFSKSFSDLTGLLAAQFLWSGTSTPKYTKPSWSFEPRKWCGFELKYKLTQAQYLHYAGMKASKDWLKQKYLKRSHQQPPLPRAQGSDVPGCPTLGCHPATDSWQPQNVPGIIQRASQCSVLPKSLEIRFFLAGGKDSRERPRGGPTPAHAPRWQPPHHRLHPCPTPATAGLALSLHVPQSGNAVQKGIFFPGHEFSLYLVRHHNKSCLAQVPPLERSHFTPVRYHPQLGLTSSVIKMQ